jgi:hypothetical protein
MFNSGVMARPFQRPFVQRQSRLETITIGQAIGVDKDQKVSTFGEWKRN